MPTARKCDRCRAEDADVHYVVRSLHTGQALDAHVCTFCFLDAASAAVSSTVAALTASLRSPPGAPPAGPGGFGGSPAVH